MHTFEHFDVVYYPFNGPWSPLVIEHHDINARQTSGSTASETNVSAHGLHSRRNFCHNDKNNTISIAKSHFFIISFEPPRSTLSPPLGMITQSESCSMNETTGSRQGEVCCRHRLWHRLNRI